MDYAHFRKIWDDALDRSALPAEAPSVDERLDLTSMDRLYRVLIPYRFHDISKSPFTVTVGFNWRWDALLSARFATTEDDLLTELFGRNHPVRSEVPFLRVNVVLQANLPRDGFYPLPDEMAWRAWSEEVEALVSPYFPLLAGDDPRKPAMVSWLDQPEIQLTGFSAGQLSLSGVSLTAGQLIRLPRQWDDRQRRRDDPQPDLQIDELFVRAGMGVEAWWDALDELVTARRQD